MKYCVVFKMKSIKNIAIYGSCISKDPFTTAFNSNYKEKYNCIINDQRHSFISTLQEEEGFDEGDLVIYPENRNNKFISKCIKEDLQKTFKYSIKSNKIDYLVFDINFEVETGVLFFDDGKVMTNITHMDKTKFYNKLKNKKVLNIFNNPKKFFNLWKSYCDDFFKFMEEESPHTKIILAEVRALNKVQKPDGTVYTEKYFTPQVELKNVFFKKFENYIIKNHNVYVIKFDNNTVLKENHRWGKHYVHYYDQYYSNFLNQVNKIVEYDELKTEIYSSENTNQYNSNFSENDFYNNLTDKNTELEEKLDQTLIELYDLKKDLLKYLTARVDILNYGTGKGITILDISDKNVFKYSPTWLDSQVASGIIVESTKKSMKIKFKSNEEGVLKIFLRSKDVRDRNRKRFPIYIDYTKFIVNDDVIFDTNKLINHDKCFIYEKPVNLDEILTIEFSWLPFNVESDFSGF